MAFFGARWVYGKINWAEAYNLAKNPNKTVRLLGKVNFNGESTADIFIKNQSKQIILTSVAKFLHDTVGVVIELTEALKAFSDMPPKNTSIIIESPNNTAKLTDMRLEIVEKK